MNEETFSRRLASCGDIAILGTRACGNEEVFTLTVDGNEEVFTLTVDGNAVGEPLQTWPQALTKFREAVLARKKGATVQ